MPRSAAVSLAVLLLMAGVGCQGPSAPPPTATSQASLPPSATPQPAQPTRTTLPPAPTATTIDDHRMAMRPGFEDDANQFAAGMHYWVTLGVTLDPVVVTGHEKLHYINHTGQTLKDAVFRLFLNGLGDKPVQSISAIAVDGQSLSMTDSGEGSVVKVTLPRDLPPDGMMDFDIDFSMSMAANVSVAYGRVLNQDGEVTLSSFLPLIAVYGPNGWSTDTPVPQGDPAYSEVALFDVQLTTPSDAKVATTGIVVGATPQNDGTTLRAIASGPVRDFSVAISKNFTKVSNTQDGITVNVWALPEARPDANQAALTEAENALRIYNQDYGPYPFSELDVVDSPISAGGIEYPGLIYIASNYWKSNYNYFEVVIAHETAHQWWYSMVGNDQINEPWLDESLADYSDEVYFRAQYGDQAGQSIRSHYQNDLDNYLAQKGNKDMPVGLPVSAYDGRQYDIFVYEKGPLLYSKLSDQFGNDAVLKLLKTYYTQYRYKIAHTHDLEQLVAEMLGQDARKLFDQMILGQ